MGLFPDDVRSALGVPHVRGGVQAQARHYLDHEAGRPRPGQGHLSIHGPEEHHGLEEGRDAAREAVRAQ